MVIIILMSLLLKLLSLSGYNEYDDFFIKVDIAGISIFSIVM